MTHLDLCSGIGGFALAASRAFGDAHEPLAFVEIDPYCRAVLAKHWPHVPQHNDLRSFDARPLRGRVGLLTGGYPCQPFSVAGKRAGAEDDRDLWPEVARVVDECRPRYCLFENAAGHVTLGLDAVLSDLEALGYACRAVVIPAVAVDAPHRRDRVWILAADADCNGAGDGRERGSLRDQDGDGAAAQRGRYHLEPGALALGRAVADAEGQPERAGLRPSQQGRERRGRPGDGSRPLATPHAHSERCEEHDAPALADRAGQHPRCAAQAGREWPPEPLVGRVAHGVPRRVDRLRAIGNAIVPDVAAAILSALPNHA